MVSTALLRDIKKSIWKISTDDGNLARFNLFNIDQYVENTMPCAKKPVLLPQANRASYQRGVWKVLSNQLCHPSFSKFGWEVKKEQVNISLMTMPPAAPDGILDNVKLYFWMFNKTLCLSESRIEVHWFLSLLRLHKFFWPEYWRERIVTW